MRNCAGHDKITQKQKNKQKTNYVEKCTKTNKQKSNVTFKLNKMFVIVLNNKKHIEITLQNYDKTMNTNQQNPA